MSSLLHKHFFSQVYLFNFDLVIMAISICRVILYLGCVDVHVHVVGGLQHPREAQKLERLHWTKPPCQETYYYQLEIGKPVILSCKFRLNYVFLDP